MNQSNMIYSQFPEDFSLSFFCSSFEEDYQFDIEQPAYYEEEQIDNCPINAVRADINVPVELYSGVSLSPAHCEKQNHFEDDSSKAEDNYSLRCVKVGTKTVMRKKSQETHSTIEVDSPKKVQDNYLELFKLIQDKNKYHIGGTEVDLKMEGNKELLKIDRILSSSDTDLNSFIGDLLISCPCDPLVKKQRV
mmetsp:Transcript_28351/g.32449  ORF Transcript_28351/g.32449 Transcript_28351/m.32449 type:complete len:192 (-) Transcript_28351:255-830(-)